MWPGPSRLRTSHPPALALANLDGPSVRSPICHTSNINGEALRWHAGFFQRQRGKLAVFAVSSGAINHDIRRVPTRGEHCRKMFLGIVTIKLVRSGDVTILVVSVVAGIDKHNRVQVVFRVAK